jgi:hypothetical protein
MSASAFQSPKPDGQLSAQLGRPDCVAHVRFGSMLSKNPVVIECLLQ